MLIKSNPLLYCSSFTHYWDPFLPPRRMSLSSLAQKAPPARFSEEKRRMSTSVIVLSPESCKLVRSQGMSTKSSRRPTRHWMVLTSRDNWLSISGRDNNIGVSGKAVNHCLSVKRLRLLWSCLYSPFSVSLFLYQTWFTTKYPALQAVSHAA